MAVPTSGNPIGMKELYNEIQESDYNSGTGTTMSDQSGNSTDRAGVGIGLQELSDGTYGTINTLNPNPDRPNGVAPHSMDEFYDYNHDESGPPPAPPPGGGA